MKPSAEKFLANFVAPLTRSERVVAWFRPSGEAHWLRRTRWERIAGVIAALSLMAYVALAAAVFGFVRYWRETAEVRFTDILLPMRWENYRVARGNQQLAEAKHYVDQRKLLEAFLFVRTGLARAPANRDGRLLAFELLLVAQRPEDARRTLLDGLQYHAADADYLKTVLTFLLRKQEDAHVVALARRYLPAAAPESDRARMLALAAATACFFRGNFDQAEDFLNTVPRLAGLREGRLLSAKLEWDRGYRELALLQLRRLAAEFPRDPEIHGELVNHLREQGLMDESRRSSLGFQISFPTQAGPRIELLFAYRQAGEADRLARETDALLRDFAGDEGALNALADFATNAGDVALMRKIATHATAHGLPSTAFSLRTVEALIVADDFRGALNAMDELKAASPASVLVDGGLADSLQAAALFGLHDNGSAEVFLGRYLRQPNLRAESLLAIARRLTNLDAAEPAKRLVARAVELDPLNQAALARLVEFELMDGDGDVLAAHTLRLVHMRRPSPDVLLAVQHRLGSDLFLFSRPCAVALTAVQQSLAGISGSRPRS